jgi:hypothetical protein
VFLFSGHMIDAPERLSPRFPPHKEAAAAREIAAALDRHQAGLDDLALACSRPQRSATWVSTSSSRPRKQLSWEPAA